MIFLITISMNFNFHGLRDSNIITTKDRIEPKPRIAGDLNVGKIHIDDTSSIRNWAIIEATYDWCTGSGTINDPYVIEHVVINGNNSDSCIIIEYSSVNFIIRDCTIFNAANGGGALHYGIYLYYVHNAKILHNDFFDNGNVGICFEGIGSNNTISFNRVFNNHRAGICFESFTDNCTISNNIIYDNGQDGIVLRYNCDNNIIQDNKIYNCGYSGILLQGGSDHNIVKDNKIYNCMSGIWIYGNSNYNTILKNDVSSNMQSGLHIEESQLNLIINNHFTDNNGPGINFDSWVDLDNTLNIVSENLIEGNSGFAVNIDEYCFDNLIFMNCFIKILLPPKDDGTNNKWDNGTIGNYWDDVNTSDTNEDGISDVPYKISGSAGSQDNFPLLKCPISQENEKINGYNLFIIVGFLSTLVIYMSRKFKKS